MKPSDFFTPDEVLKQIVPRVWQRSTYSEPIATLEVIDGPYAGVVFSYRSFKVGGNRLYQGMVPMKFELEFYQSPPGFEPDDAFREYASSVVMAWFSYLQRTDMQTFYQMPMSSVVH